MNNIALSKKCTHEEYLISPIFQGPHYEKTGITQ